MATPAVTVIAPAVPLGNAFHTQRYVSAPGAEIPSAAPLRLLPCGVGDEALSFLLEPEPGVIAKAERSRIFIDPVYAEFLAELVKIYIA